MKHYSPYITSLNNNIDAPYTLYCFSHAGGSGQNFYEWRRQLPPCIDHRIINLPGRGSRFNELPLESIHIMADEICRAILRCPNQKILFYGHSMGAALAYETALRLEKHHVFIEHLYVGAFRAPQLPALSRTIHHLPQKEFYRELIKLGATDASIVNNNELMELIIPMLRADFKAIETYRANPKRLYSKITAFYGKHDHRASLEHMQKWSQCTQECFNIIGLNASHFFHSSHVTEVTTVIARTINTDYCDAKSA
jgi:medium-chain acyl-[acyl-carrier-protein] hydrolase